MTKSPAFQFYPADYLSDEKVILMTAEEEGCYWRLVAYCWHQGSIPADQDLLCRMVKNTLNQPSSLVRSCFVEMSNQPSRLVHKRLEIERQKQEAWRTKSAEAGRKSGKARRVKKLHTEPTFENGSNQMPTKHEPNTNSSSMSSSSSSSTKELNTETLVEYDSTFESATIQKMFLFYCESLFRDPKRYQLTAKRKLKARQRYRERLKLHSGDRDAVEKDFASAIENLAENSYCRDNGYIDWIEQIFRSEEEFDKRLNWIKPNGNGGSNGHYESKSERLQREALEIMARSEAHDA